MSLYTRLWNAPTISATALETALSGRLAGDTVADGVAALSLTGQDALDYQKLTDHLSLCGDPQGALVEMKAWFDKAVAGTEPDAYRSEAAFHAAFETLSEFSPSP